MLTWLPSQSPARWTLLSGLVALLAFGNRAASAQIVRDSAGIHIIDNARPVWSAGQEWRVSPEPVVDIDGSGGPEYEFGRVAGVVRLTDGRIVAADQQALQLRFYDSTGHHLKSVGRKGQGPGEFTDLSTVSRLPGDTLAVDIRMGASLFTPTGTFVRNVRFGPFPPGVLQTPMVMVLGRFDDGLTVVSDYPQGLRRPGGAPVSMKTGEDHSYFSVICPIGTNSWSN